jgi:hypothetical protein
MNHFKNFLFMLLLASCGPATPVIVDKVPFDTKGCIGSTDPAAVAIEKTVCADWVGEYELGILNGSDKRCQNILPCKVAQKGCRLYIDCADLGPATCADLEPFDNNFSGHSNFRNEPYTVIISFKKEQSTSVFNYYFKSANTFACYYK